MFALLAASGRAACRLRRERGSAGPLCW